MPTERERAAYAHRVAIITGGSSGVGGAIGRELAGQGYAVSLAYLGGVTAAEAVVEEILSSSGVALGVRADVGDELDVERLFAETARAFLGVDVVVHTRAATGEPELDLQVARPRWRVRALHLVTREASRRLREGGALVNLCSLADPATTRVVGRVTRVLSRELVDRDITVNAVASRFEDPERCSEAVDLVAFLVGERGRGISGRVIQLDEPGHVPGVTPGATHPRRRDGRRTSSNGGEHEHD